MYGGASGRFMQCRCCVYGGASGRFMQCRCSVYGGASGRFLQGVIAESSKNKGPQSKWLNDCDAAISV